MGIFDFADAVTLQQYIGALNTIRENILNLYTKKTGREKDEVAAWMDATSWWTGEEAKTNGFVDELVDDGEKTVVENRGGLLFVNSVNMNLPFDKAPKFVQNSVAAAPAASGFVNTPTPAEQPGNNSHKEDTNMANEIKTVDELRGAYPALVDQIEQAAALRATNAERQRMLNPLTVVNLTFRAAQQVYDKTGGYDFKGLRVVEMGRVKKFKPGKIEKSEGMEATVTLELTYIMIEVDGEQLIEIDKLNGVYKVKGVDMLAKVRSLI